MRLYSMQGGLRVAWGSSWAGSRSTKPCVFPCEVAPAGDERYLVCAAGVAALEPVRIGSSSVLHRVVVHVCLVLCGF